MSLSVLVVDDEKSLTDLITESLKSFNVFKTVIPAYDGIDAMRKLTNQSFDIVILDLAMPKKDGMEVLSYISDEDLCHSKVIIISGSLTADVIGEARNHTNHFLAKPFKIEDLKMKIGQVIKEIKAAA
ncbi:response regulator [Bacteriovorax sp. DB6_IX]|uniref:response regulator n=1 Tax=Bacteriovorax sp. DB6_IX TaxID=1353530 RepID=UPI00038A43FB|nr:response regulator [Bacteriovorax sp. DB6_IX]EQC51217.1 response regulator receiver domain protein [Bacteriovorax sp. DB6_IX]